MKKETGSKRQKRREFHVFFNRSSAKIGLPWIIQAGKKKLGASHVTFSGVDIHTFEGPFSAEIPRFSIIVFGTLKMKGN